MKFIRTVMILTSIPWIVATILLFLKIFGIISISWIMAFSPLWVPISTLIGAIIILGGAAILGSMFSE